MRIRESSKFLLGVDVGGTKISVVLGNTQGRFLEKRVFPTRKGASALESVDQIIQTFSSLLKKFSLSQNRILGLGGGVPGPMNPSRGVIEFSPNMPGWQGIPLLGMLKKRFSFPMILDNDANAACLAEKYFGGAKKCRNFIYLTISTGIGGGVYSHGELIRGSNFAAGEAGHMVIQTGGRLCGCARRGCLEAYSSGTAIAKEAKRLLRSGEKTRLTKFVDDLEDVTAEDVAEAAKTGDRLARGILIEAGNYLGIGLANLIHLLNPEKIILGGGVIKSGRSFWEAVNSSLKKEAWEYPLKVCRLERTTLGDRVGDLGGLSLVLDTFMRL